MDNINKEIMCCICGGTYKQWGNNPAPLPYEEGDKCCDACDLRFVIPIRMLRLAQGKPMREKRMFRLYPDAS